MKTNASATVYNKFITGGTEQWARMFLGVCKWENRKASNVIKSGLIAADAVTIYLPNSPIANYIKPVTWAALVSHTGLYTLRPGDYIVKGEVTQEIAGAYTITNLKADFDDVIKITSVDYMDSGRLNLRHFQLGCS